MYHPVEDCPELYHISIERESTLDESTVPFHWQIIDNNAIMVHQLSKKLGGKIVKIKTDCIVVENGSRVECKQGIGQYREEQVPTSFNVSFPFENKYSYTLKKIEWNQECTGYNRLLTGRAGTGKSFQMKQDLGHLGRYVLLGTTNTVAKLINGQTIHHYFQIDINGKYDKYLILNKCSKLDYIIIDEVGLMQAYLYEILYCMHRNSKVKFILLGDYEQLPGVETKSYDYLNSTVLKELVGCNIQVLTVNHRCPPDLFALFDKVDELTSQDFGNSKTKRHLCRTNNTRIRVNQEMMELDKLKKKKMLFVENNASDKNSQDVRLMNGTPVMAIRNNKSMGFVNGSTFRVKSIEPLILKDTIANEDITINKDIFKEYFYVNYCSTVHRCQGETITEPFTIHEWNRMDTRMRYTAISRAISTNLINISDETEQVVDEIQDTDFQQVKLQQKRNKRMNDLMYNKRIKSMNIINRIIRNGCSDEYSVKHTQLTRQELLNQLKIPNEIVPRGYEIDHIKPRHLHSTEQEFKDINAYWNLRLLPRKDNNERN
jgi:hypothetical protein